MPDESGSWTTSDTAAAAQVASSAINYASAAAANRKGRKWALEMYNRQRADALTDWNMQNEYNSPAAQMARLKAGGLNPNLVYGDGANSPSVAIRSSSADSGYKPDAPRMDVSGAANSMLAAVGLRNTEAQTDNLKTQNELIKQQILNTAANTQNVGQQTATSEFNLSQLKAKAVTDIELLKSTLEKSQADVEYTKAQNVRSGIATEIALRQDERNALINNQTLQKGIEEILNLRATRAATDTQRKHAAQSIINLKTDNRLKELDEILKKAGIQPHDPAYIRMGKKLIDALPSPKRFKKMVDDAIHGMLNNSKEFKY